MKQNIIETDINKVKAWSKSLALDSDLIITEHINEAPIPTEPRRMNFILIGLCTKGQVLYQLDTQQMTINPGDILIVSEHRVVDHYEHTPDMEGLCIMMSPDFFQEIIKDVKDISSLFLFTRTHPVLKLTPKENETFEEYFRAITRKISDQENQFRRHLVRTLLLAMFYDLSNMIFRVQQSDRRQTRADIIFTQFIKLVEQNFRHERRVSWYAQELCITPKYLSESIKNVSHRTPNEWINNYVTMELRVMLKNSTKNIKEIAEELHFPNQSFLGKFFKEHVGMSPSQYRRS